MSSNERPGLNEKKNELNFVPNLTCASNFVNNIYIKKILTEADFQNFFLQS